MVAAAPAIPLILMAATTVASGVMGYMQSQQAAGAAEAEAAAYESQKQESELAAIEDERARRADLNRTLSAQKAAAAAMGFDIQSGDFRTMQRVDTEDAEREIKLGQISAKMTQARLGMAARSSRSASGTHRLSGLMRFGTSLLEAGYGAAKYGS